MKLLLTFLLFSSFLFGQNNSQETMLVYPKCEKFIKDGNDSLQSCFLGKFIEEMWQESLFILSSKKIAYTDIRAEMKFVIDENGNFTSLEFIGNDFNKELMKDSFDMYLNKYNKKKKKIVPAKDANGNPISKSFYIPYVLKKDLPTYRAY